MAFWRGERLRELGASLIVPFDENQIDCNAYLLRMGDRYFRTSDGDPNDTEGRKKSLLSAGQSFVIPPGQFAYLLTKEAVRVPRDAMAFISTRTQSKFEGLINVSGFHVDPGYEGKLLFAAFNASPSSIPIFEGDLLFKIWFCDLRALDGEAVEPSKYEKRPDEGV